MKKGKNQDISKLLAEALEQMSAAEAARLYQDKIKAHTGSSWVTFEDRVSRLSGDSYRVAVIYRVSDRGQALRPLSLTLSQARAILDPNVLTKLKGWLDEALGKTQANKETGS